MREAKIVTKTKPRWPSLGTVSHGTTRDEDLIPTFAGELQDLVKGRRLTRYVRQCVNHALREVRRFDLDDITYDPSELTNELFDCLNLLSPPYVYFGANEGDGSDYGFWPQTDDAVQAGDLEESDGTIDEKGFYLNAHGERIIGDLVMVNDHGNVTCGRQARNGRFVEYWSCV